jgi:hypothetical protein
MGTKKLCLSLFNHPFQQTYAGPFRAAILKMLARPHELMHTFSVD